MDGFFEELKRRKVYRVAIAYVVASWALAQGLAQVLPVFDISNSAIRVVIALLLFGFPVALVLAWVFDITPAGIRRTSSAAAQTAPTTHRRRNLFLLAAAGVIISAGVGFFVLPRAAAHKVDKSIAVLPFENLSDEKENAYFADGVQDDILTNLSKVGDLKVISRTSVMPYRGKTSNVREIGKELGVGAILEGSVRRSGNRVRVNVQLIDANTDEHIWANDYDRDLTDVFAIQTDLAQKIANELQAKLSPTEKAFLERKPTENGEAYLAYIQAMNLFVPDDNEKLKQGEQLYQRAIDLDPSFALAYARFSNLESWIFHSFDPSASRRVKARAAAEQALKLQPNLPEAHLALGYCYYYGDLDYDRALEEFNIAQKGLPNDPDVLLSLGAIQRRQGKWAESTANFEKAATVSPKDAWVLQNLGINYASVRNWDAAIRIFDRGIALSPSSMGLHAMRAQVAISSRGDLSFGKQELADVPLGFDPDGLVTEARVIYLIYERKFAEGLDLLQKLKGETLHGENGAPTPKSLLMGECYYFLGDKPKAHEAMERARAFVEQQLRETPDDASRHSQLGMIFAALGRKEDAIREGKRASELLPEGKDAFDGPSVSTTLAQIYAWTGETDQALQLVEHLLNTPAGLTAPVLKLDPVWDPLRKDPRFQALIDKYGAKT
ncbi:MAG TPA: tetratricopeptide repeat protein [Chthoniobacterales bacterium]|jgi:TolB-like protein/Flp pilus assembly protein TadD|nr:tetratricopeptide repeat protein [Chthoniobacterales bacterium]